MAAPWQISATVGTAGSGVIIEGQRILTSAHLVSNAASIEAVRADRSEPHAARVAFLGHDADLALLEVDDPSFFEGARPLSLGDAPTLQQVVQVWGFPMGGRSVSITSGVVSRVEVESYSQSGRALLRTQIDAAINPGNSGGPVLSDGDLVGVAMQVLRGAENVGYVVPAPVVHHFLKDTEDGRYHGFPRLGVRVQELHSEAQRLAVGLVRSRSGVLVIRVDYGSPASRVLQPGDVLISIDARPIANDGTTYWPGLGRVRYSFIPQSKQVGETVSLRFLRRGEMRRATLTLTANEELVPGRRTTQRPRYLIFAGLVFQPLSKDYFDVFLRPPDTLTSLARNRVVTKAQREIILMQRVLPHPVNRGYQDMSDEVVAAVGGKVPRDLDHLARILDAAPGRFLEVLMEDGHVITVDLPSARAAAEEIEERYGIPADRYLGEEVGPGPRRDRKRRDGRPAPGNREISRQR